MLAEKLFGLFRAGDGPPINGAGAMPKRNGRALASMPSLDPPVTDRTSNGLRQFFENLRGQTQMRILDLGGASQANINFITVQGHKLYTEDLLVGLDRLNAPAREARSAEAPGALLLQENLNFGPEQFDGILGWDALEFLDENLLAAAVSRLQTILKPGGSLLTFFHTHAKGETVAIYRYQIRNHQTLDLRPRGLRTLPRAFNNRSLERLFVNFHAVKFFLSKENLREVIVTR